MFWPSLYFTSLLHTQRGCPNSRSGTYCCISVTTLNTFILLTATPTPRTRRQAMYIQRNIEARPYNQCCSGNIFWVCVCSLRYPARNAHYPALQYFPTLSHKLHYFRKKKKDNIKYVFWFSLQLLYETFLSLRRTERDMIRYEYWSSCKVPVVPVRF